MVEKKIVSITGITGFVGSNLKKYLSHTYEIKPLSVRYETNQKFKLTGDAIIHLAGKAHDLNKVSNPNDYYEANFELTKQLFDAFLKSEGSAFVFMSTVKAVADEVDGVLTESSISNPKTHYGISKHQAENYILSKVIPKDKRIYILRPCMIHGPENKGNLNALFNLVSKGIPWPLGAFDNQRSFLSIENLCFVIKELVENISIPSGVYQVADDGTLSTNELIHLLGKSLNKKSIILTISPSWIKRIAKLGDSFYLPLNSERLIKLTENYVVANDKIISNIGKPLPVSCHEGLIRTFESFKKNKK